MPTKIKQPNKSPQEIRQSLEKIVINAGVGRLSQQSNFSSPVEEKSTLKDIFRDLSLIAGQQPQVRPAKKSIATFKIRQGQTIGIRVTLRRQKMVDFFERLIKIVLPRVRDFRGIDLKSIDGGGTLNIGFREQIVFPEINPEEVRVIFSLGVNVVPRRKNRTEAMEIYRRLGVPLKKQK